MVAFEGNSYLTGALKAQPTCNLTKKGLGRDGGKTGPYGKISSID